VARASFRRSLATDPDQVRSRKATANIPKRSPNFNRLFIQLWLDPDTTWLEYVESLPLPVPEGNVNVMIEMLVADRDEGRVAFDIVDERPARDIDSEGLLLLALEHHEIRLAEMDSASINAEPRASNSLRIWRHRDCRVKQGLVAAIDRAFAGQQSIPIRTLGTLTGFSDPIRTVSALICQGMLDTDLSVRFGPNSFVARRADLGAALTSQNRSAVRLFTREKHEREHMAADAARSQAFRPPLSRRNTPAARTDGKIS
jgi:hypothetical protein